MTEKPFDPTKLNLALSVLEIDYPLPWRVAQRSYDHEQVIASGNRVLANCFACAGNTEQRKAIVELINAIPELLARTNPMTEEEKEDLIYALWAKWRDAIGAASNDEKKHYFIMGARAVIHHLEGCHDL